MRKQNLHLMLKKIVWMIMIVFLSVVPSLRGSKEMSLLLGDLFKNYSTDVWPRVNVTTPIELQVGLGIIAVVGLDTKDQALNVRGYVTAAWTDEYLQWIPEDYGNISSVVLSQNKVWKPDLGLVRSLDPEMYLGVDETRLVLNSNGRILWQPSFNSRFTCRVDVAKFPLDVNICKISVGSWMYNTKRITLSLYKDHTFLEPEVSNGEFDIGVEDPYLTILWYDGIPHHMMDFRIKLSRKPAHTFLSLVMPMFVIGLLTPISFLIPADSTEKVDISLNILLATTVCIGVVSGHLPERSDKISSLAVYVVFLLLLSFLGVLGNTIVLLVNRREESRQSTADNSPVTSSSSNSRDFKFNASLRDPHTKQGYRDGEDDENRSCSSDTYRVKIKNSRSTMSKADKLNWLFFALNIFGLVVSFLAVIVQIIC